MAITADDIRATRGIPFASPDDADWAASVAAGVNAYVNKLPHVIKAGGVWDDMTTLGARMLGQRAYEARSAPLGAAGMDVAGALVKASTDPEVGRYLRIGGYTTPRAG